MRRHAGIDWSDAHAKLVASPEKLHTLSEMERTGGEPDIVGYNDKPGGNAIEMASSMGVEILTENQYRQLQELGEFDRKTSSWVVTPAGIRAARLTFSSAEPNNDRVQETAYWHGDRL